MATCKYCGNWFSDGSGWKKNYCCQACYENSDERRQEKILHNLIYNDDSFSGVLARSLWFTGAWFSLFLFTGIFGTFVMEKGLKVLCIYIGSLYGLSLFQSILMIHKRKGTRVLIVLGIPFLIVAVFFYFYGIPFIS